MDRDFALSLAESENRTTADSSTSPELPRDLGRHVTDVIMDSILNFDNIFASKFILGDAINFVQTCNYHNCLCIMYFVLSVMNYNTLVFLDE